MDYRDVTSVLLALMVLLTTCAEGLVHCHCNSPSCISSGYMCISEMGQCYSLYSNTGPLTMASYGCRDSLASDDGGAEDLPCSGGEIKGKRTSGKDGESVLLCCTSDMCNHLSERDVEVVKTLNSAASGEHSAPPHDSPRNYDSSEQDLWFRASVIGVPISGGFVLVFLVILAFRMLKNDKKRQSRILQLRTEQSLAKAQLYVTDHFQKKSAVNFKSDSTNSDNAAHNNNLCKEYCKINIREEKPGVQGYSEIDNREGKAGVHEYGKVGRSEIWIGSSHPKGSIV